MDLRWPQYLLERAGRVPPEDCHIVPGSTPVVSFGHPLHPEVATLGINPSSSEFLSKDGGLLVGAKRRLATLQSLGISNHEDINSQTAARIIDDCATYFHRRPYHWFNVLDQILSQALAVSYRDDTALHLDLVQWASDPLWRGLSDTTRARLLSEDRPFLLRQLRHERYRLIVVAGRTALSWVQRAGLVVWTQVAELDGELAATFYVGDTTVPRFVGWSCNLQSQPGAPRHIPQLVELLGRHAETGGEGDILPEDYDLLPKGTHFRSRSELITQLEAWLDRTDSATIGDISRFSRAPWLSFETPEGLVDLNADTQRAAIQQMVDHMRLDPTAPWYVVANRRGRVNKVLFAPDDSAYGWYAYLRTPVAEPTTIWEPAFPGGREQGNVRTTP